MRIREIPRDQWLHFLKDFSRRRQNWYVLLILFATNPNNLSNSLKTPLRSISYHQSVASSPTISITVGHEKGTHLRHRILEPSRLRLLEDETGLSEELEIKSAEGGSTRVLISSTPTGNSF